MQSRVKRSGIKLAWERPLAAQVPATSERASANALASKAAQAARTNGPTKAVWHRSGLLVRSDAYSYGLTPPAPFTGYLGALPLVRPDTFPKRSADGEAIRFPYPSAGEPSRCLW